MELAFLVDILLGCIQHVCRSMPQGKLFLGTVDSYSQQSVLLDPMDPILEAQLYSACGGPLHVQCNAIIGMQIRLKLNLNSKEFISNSKSCEFNLNIVTIRANSYQIQIRGNSCEFEPATLTNSGQM